MHRLLCHVHICVAYLLLLPVIAGGGQPSDEFAQLETKYAAQLAELAAWCDEHQLASQAELTRNWLPKRDPLKDYVFVIPESSEAPSRLVESADAKQWWKRFTELRQAQAEKLFEIAEAAAKNKQPALAIQLARQTLRENPDHERTRKILGFEQYDGRWVLPKVALWLKAGKIWSEDFGWLPADQLAKYKNGQRLNHGKWIDAAEDARLHNNATNAWRIETEHYLVRATHSLEEGVKLARKLESLYDVWRAIFVDYYATPTMVEQWFSTDTGPKANTTRKPFTVVLFRDKEEYIDALRTMQPQVEMSVGTYMDRLKVAYFFAGKDQAPSTLYHEATHQLFREERPGAIEPGRKNNFWVVEAIACYMESLTEHRPLADCDYGMYFTLGGADEGRVPISRARLQEEYLFFKPLRELAPLGLDALQRESQLPQIYSQIAGMAWFFMHADNGQYRPALIALLIAVYTGRATETTLEKQTGLKYEELDNKYRAFMK